MGKTVKDREYSFNHCVERAEQRYGLALTRQAWEDWATQCREGLDAIHRNVNGDVIQTTHVIYWWGVKIIVVYEDKRDCITTLLPPEKDYHFAGRLIDKARFCAKCSEVHRPSDACI
jgi:hypothetical protein